MENTGWINRNLWGEGVLCRKGKSLPLTLGHQQAPGQSSIFQQRQQDLIVRQGCDKEAKLAAEQVAPRMWSLVQDTLQGLLHTLEVSSF